MTNNEKYIDNATIHTYVYTVCQKNVCTEEKNFKCDLHSRIQTIKSLHTFYFCTHSITKLVYDHKAPIIF